MNINYNTESKMISTQIIVDQCTIFNIDHYDFKILKMMHNQIISTFILTSLLLLSCKETEKHPYEAELLVEVLNEMTEYNLRIVEIIQSEVEKKGRRGVDVEALKSAKGIFEHRKNHKLPLDQNTVVGFQDFDGLDKYLQYLDSNRISYRYDTQQKYWTRRMANIRYIYSRIKGEYNTNDALNIMLNVSLLERELLWDLCENVSGSGCGFGIDFNYSFENDTVHTNQEFEMIIVPIEIDSQFVLKYDYTEAEILLDDISFNDFELKSIGLSAYLKFTPKEPGVYHFKALYKANFGEGEYTFARPLHKEIVVLE